MGGRQTNSGEHQLALLMLKVLPADGVLPEAAGNPGETSGHNRAEPRLGHANDRYLRLYTNPPDDIAASYIEDL